MKINVICDGCGARINAPQKMAGQIANCPRCGEEVHVPASDLDPEETGSVGELIGGSTEEFEKNESGADDEFFDTELWEEEEDDSDGYRPLQKPSVEQQPKKSTPTGTALRRTPSQRKRDLAEVASEGTSAMRVITGIFCAFVFVAMVGVLLLMDVTVGDRYNPGLLAFRHDSLIVMGVLVITLAISTKGSG